MEGSRVPLCDLSTYVVGNITCAAASRAVVGTIKDLGPQGGRLVRFLSTRARIERARES